jgi:N-acetylmuramoyl-L-alanine amidase
VLGAPNLRGDDVAELQAMLARLGFDCGRVDGIFGPGTLRALEDFQRNCGLYDDGICGPDTVKALQVLNSTDRDRARCLGGPRARAADRRCARARDLRVVVGQFGG